MNDIVTTEIRRRAKRELSIREIWVDYYRIDQKLFYPLPVEQFPGAGSTVCGIPNYPYAIWLLWRLEDRILALGWHAEWSSDPASRRAATLDLQALAGWQRYRERNEPDLCVAHIARILCVALQWQWPSAGLKRTLRAALTRMVDACVRIMKPLRAKTVDALMALDISLANIPVIGSLGLARAALVCKHPRADALWQRADLMARGWLTHGMNGHLEGVCYDGYTADFLLDTAALAPAAAKKALLEHPRLVRTLEESAYLGTPRKPENIALIGDVEPYHMRFHYSFVCKYLLAGGTLPEKGMPMPAKAHTFLRTDALPAFAKIRIPRPKARAGTVLDAHYALALQAAGPALKTVVSWNHSRMGHMQADAGSLVVGMDDAWLITDPGYRQYMPTPEKTFTLGPMAHNQPIINGHAADGRLTCRDYDCFDANGPGIELDLTGLYAAQAGVQRAVRSVQCQPGILRVRDTLSGQGIQQVEYCWHGHADAYWRMDGGQATLRRAHSSLTIRCAGHPLEPAELCSLPGARGQMSLHKSIRFPRGRRQVEIEWCFETGIAGQGAPSSGGVKY